MMSLRILKREKVKTMTKSKLVAAAFLGIFIASCGGDQKSRTANLVEGEGDPDLVAELTGIDEGTYVEPDKQDVDQADRPSSELGNPSAGKDENNIGGSQGAFNAKMFINGEETKGTYTIRKATNEGEIVRENVRTGTDVALPPGIYDMTFQTNDIVGNPEFPLRDVEIEKGRRAKRDVKVPVGKITLTTGKNCARKPLRIKLKGATDWYKGSFTTCKPLTLMAGEYDAEVGPPNRGTPVSGIQVYDGGVRDILIRNQ